VTSTGQDLNDRGGDRTERKLKSGMTKPAASLTKSSGTKEIHPAASHGYSTSDRKKGRDERKTKEGDYYEKI